ncbi:hypothetical protein D3C87_1778310 [compost metagenome]
MGTADGTDADGADFEEAGVQNGLVDRAAQAVEIDALVEIGGMFDREVRHFPSPGLIELLFNMLTIWRALSSGFGARRFFAGNCGKGKNRS